MCGIACVVKQKDSLLNCFNALEKLTYTGYDSAGIACLNCESINYMKDVGSVEKFKDFVENQNECFMSISHTRWATHGKITKENAHPHLSFDNQVAVVQNGIIENYLEIKKDLECRGVNFVSETDTECVSHFLALEKNDFVQRLIKLKSLIKGNYAISVLSKETQALYGLRHRNPLYVAKTSKGTMIVSDLFCLEDIESEYYLLKEDQVVKVDENGNVFVFDMFGASVKFEYTVLNKLENNADKLGFDYYMEKEINDIPIMIKNIINNYKNFDLLKHINIENITEIKLVGCGTAYHASLYGAKVLEKYLRIPCHAYIASEFQYSNPIINQNTLLIFVSQSGETMDTLGCVELAKKYNAKTISITNVSHSTIAQTTDVNLPVQAGREIAIASTKAYVAQILVLYILARYLKDNNYDFSDLKDLPNYAKSLINIDNEIVDLVKSKSKVFFIGRGIDSITSLEASLKLKETSYKSSEGYPAGELKHGPIAMVEDGTPVIVFATESNLIEKVLNASTEVKSRGAKVVLVAKDEVDKKYYDYLVKMPKNLNPDLCAFLTIIPFQLLAFETCKNLGYDPDKPRNLSKSVTVE